MTPNEALTVVSSDDSLFSVSCMSFALEMSFASLENEHIWCNKQS